MKPNALLSPCVHEIGYFDADLALRFLRVVEQNSRKDDVGVAFSKVAPFTKGDERSAVANLRRDEEVEDDGNDQSYDALN
jgi:hypothetical protein